MLKQWSKRKLTLFGRITIIKSLALSKFVSLFLSLPNPPMELIKELEVMFFKFLWNAGPDRITRKLVIKNLSSGGLRMSHIYSFIKALKISWLRRVIQQANNTTWYILNPIDFDKVLSLGGEYARNLAVNIRNPFWKDILISWADFSKEVKFEEIKYILSSPIWFNTHLRNGNNLYVNNWYNKGIKTNGDILDDNGNFYTFDQLKEIYRVRGTFLSYENILQKIPNQWKNIIIANIVFIYQNRYNITCNVFVAHLLKDKKGSRRFYDILAHVGETGVTNRWGNQFGNINDKEWKLYNSSIKDIKEVKLADFQYKINNKILVTNSFLFKIKKINNNGCSYCNEHGETIEHLFSSCTKVKYFWNNLQDWLSNNCNIILNLDENHLSSHHKKQKA